MRVTVPVDPPTGYTDASGQEPYNVALSLRRAAFAYLLLGAAR